MNQSTIKSIGFWKKNLSILLDKYKNKNTKDTLNFAAKIIDLGACIMS